MIKAHFHNFEDRKSWHVYSDVDVHELIDWMAEKEIPAFWLQDEKFPHVDLWGSSAKYLKGLKMVSNIEFYEDMDRFKRVEK